MKNPVAKKALFSDLETAIKKKKFQPVYFLYGKEDFFIDEITLLLRRYVFNSEADAEMNTVMLQGSETSIGEVISQASAFGMFAAERLVIVRGFERIRKERTKEKLKVQMEMLAAYLKNPAPATVLVLTAADLDKKELAKEPYSLLADVGYEFAPMKDAAGFASDRAKSLGWNLLPGALRILMQHTGNAVRDISGELQKLSLYAEGRAEKVLTETDVMEVVGVSREYNVFELEKAIVSRDLRQASGIALMMLEKDGEPLSIVNYLTVFFVRLWKLGTPEVKRMSDGDAAKELGMFGGQAFFLGNYKSYLAAFAPEQIQTALVALHETDLALKGQRTISATSQDERDKLLMLVLMRKVLS
ncbi:MAG: DNA polymerase III subunit delta [Rhizobacter sp.]|nr:DNA polymerase III subunit delta [Chlorobiales bacterium]